jgi:hypothetical protein
LSRPSRLEGRCASRIEITGTRPVMTRYGSRRL